MAGHGGARPGSGAKKNSNKILSSELRKELETTLGMPYARMLAETQLKLFNDFKSDINVKEFITFTENMSKRILEQPVQEIALDDVTKDMTPQEIDDRIANLLTRQVLTTDTKVEPSE